MSGDDTNEHQRSTHTCEQNKMVLATKTQLPKRMLTTHTEMCTRQKSIGLLTTTHSLASAHIQQGCKHKFIECTNTWSPLLKHNKLLTESSKHLSASASDVSSAVVLASASDLASALVLSSTSDSALAPVLAPTSASKLTPKLLL